MNIIKALIYKIKNLDIQIKKIMKIGFNFSLIISIIGALSLFTYEFFYSFPLLFYIGFSLFRSSLMFVCTFIMFGIGFDTIKKERI